MSGIKAVDTDSLEALICDAARRKYNQQLDLKRFETITDPEGIHVLQQMMIHHHRGGQLCEPHARCRVLLKIKHHELPVEGWLDVELKQFEALPDIGAILTPLPEAGEAP
jgi:hypothetical protein